MARRSPKMTAKRRKSLSKSTFGLPSQRKYPLDTRNRAANALARVAQHGTPAQKRTVRAKATKKYPSLKRTGKK